MASLAASNPPSGTPPHVDYDEIKRQVERYILEQRAHGPLLQADSAAPSRARPTSLTGRFRRRPLSRRVSRASTPTARGLRLRAIFDTPGCRTDSSSSLLACHLQRHGATFRRVEEAVVEATERRRRRWARGSVLPSDDDDEDDEDDAAAAAAAAADDEPDWSDTSSCYSRDTDTDTDTDTNTDIDEDEGQGNLAPVTRLGRAPTQVGSSSLFSRTANERTRPSLCRNPSSKSFVRGDDRRFFHASTRIDRAAWRPDPTKVDRADYVVPVTIISETPLDTDTATTEPECDHVTHSDDGEEASNTTAPTRNPRNTHPFPTTSQAEQAKAWRWLATKRIPSVRRVRSVSRRAKTRLVHNNRAAAARARAIGGSLSETVNSRLFERIEVQEMIGPADLSAAVLNQASEHESHPDEDGDPATVAVTTTTADDTKDAGPFAVLRRVFEAARPDSGRRATFSGLPPPRRTGASGRCQSQDHLATISEASPLRLDARDASAPDPDPQCAADDDSDRCSLTRTVSSLSSRHEPFSADDDFRAASSLSGTSSVSALGHDWRRENSRTDAGHRSSTSSADNLDLTMYQMAISGGTGDYFMAGGEGATDDECHDDLVDWFLTLGFESEGALVRAEPVDELYHDCDYHDDYDDDYDAFTDDGVSIYPGQSLSSSTTSSARTSMNTTTAKPTVEARQGPVSTTKTATDPDADGWQMSCNLTNLGDFLNLEVYHMNALGGGDDVVRRWA